MTALTEKEARVMEAIVALDEQYNNEPEHPSCYTTLIAREAGIAERSLGGVVASLVKKGLAWSSDDADSFMSGYDMREVGLTPEGVKAVGGEG